MAELNVDKMAKSVAERAMQELRDNGVFVSRWIPVSERLPEIGVEVLATTEWGDIGIAMNIDGHKWFLSDKVDTIITNDLKAWMPLPAPYKEGDNECR